jgi:DNA-binding NtrC family response regulator
MPEAARPGLVLVWSGAAPAHLTLRAGTGISVEIGRASMQKHEDKLMSRQHARVWHEPGGWRVEDLASRNGTAVDGRRVVGEARGPFRVLRTAGSLWLLVDDVRPYEIGPVEVSGDSVIGARLRQAWNQIRKSAANATLHITGETGAGKELGARVYHQAGPRPEGPFVAVNCAAIPEGVAERLLFGARRGAYSGADKDAEGFVQTADGGTLFLDEIGDLSLAVQAKLLRVLETREVLALGAARPTPISLRLCSATHHDLRTLVADGKFREDLFYRVARPHVAIPPLRERLDEIPHLVALAARKVAPSVPVHVTLVEACLLRRWPGNVRELIAEVGDATRQVSSRGDIGELGVTAQHLAARAGTGFARAPAERVAPGATPTAAAAPLPAREVIEEALRAHGGQVATTARALGLRRNQLRRWLATHKVDPRSFGAATQDEPEDDDGDGEETGGASG